MLCEQCLNIRRAHYAFRLGCDMAAVAEDHREAFNVVLFAPMELGYAAVRRPIVLYSARQKNCTAFYRHAS